MNTIYDSSIDEWVCTCAAGEFYGATAKDAEAQAREALRVQNDHARRNTWTPVAPGVYEVKDAGR